MTLDSSEPGFAQAYTAYGAPFRLVSNEPAVLAAMSTTVPFGTSLAPEAIEATAFALNTGPGGMYRLTVPEEEHIAFDLSQLLEALGTSLMVHVANYAADRVFVHAGVVGYRGRALVLPGASFAGKSTLTAALVRAGATYYSDEYAVFDSEGSVYPYARDLSLRKPGETRQQQTPVQQLGGIEGTERLPVALVVFTHYEEGALWRPQRVSSGMALLEMLKHSIAIQRTPARVMTTLSNVLQTATAWASPRGDAEETARALLDWLASSQPQLRTGHKDTETP